MRKRHGWTLIELLIVITMSTLLVGIALALLIGLMRFSVAQQEQARTAGSVGRLAEQFRRDVHQAAAVPPSGDDRQTIKLELPEGRTVTYRIATGKPLQREETGPAGRQEDAFAMAELAALAFETRKLGETTIVSLVIESPGITGPTLRIDAVLAKDHHFGVKEENR